MTSSYETRRHHQYHRRLRVSHSHRLASLAYLILPANPHTTPHTTPHTNPHTNPHTTPHPTPQVDMGYVTNERAAYKSEYEDRGYATYAGSG